MLNITKLKVSVTAGTKPKPILKEMDLTVKPGELVAVMGPNGSGKSTLAYALAGHPHYQVTGGKMTLDRKSLLKLSPDERSLAGLFLAFQYPVAIPGVSLDQFLMAAYEKRVNKKMAPFEFKKILTGKAKSLGVDEKLLSRSLNDGFSGGEKKRVEVLQLALLNPKYAVMDETDSGLDIDALRVVSEGVNRIRKQNPKLGIVMITHYRRILDYVKPDRVVVMADGQVVESGGYDLVERLEKTGYKGL
jgi:Fe-S cluster assembly ATP-binding protein